MPLQRAWPIAVAFALIVSSCPTASAGWKKIGPGPSLDYATAYCDNQALLLPHRGFFAFGSPAFVGAASFGYGLGALIRRERFKSNCLIMKGWKHVN